jgi:hypothetical protein
VNQDFIDLLRALCDAEARFLIVGAYAVSFHAEPCTTGDLDIWVEPSRDNARRVHAALAAFGAPLTSSASTTSARLESCSRWVCPRVGSSS